MPGLTILIPAAGASSRMAGTDKLLQIVGAQPMLRADAAMTGAAMTGAAMMILPADMPDLDASDLRKPIEAFVHDPAEIHRGAAPDGAPGHPVILPAWALAQVATLTGDQGARVILARHPSRINLIALPDQHTITDLDTPEDWASWRAAQAASSTRAS